MHAWLHGAGSIIEIVLLPLSTALSYAAAAGVIYLLASLLTRSVPSHASTRDGEEGGTNNKRSHDVGVSLPSASLRSFCPLCAHDRLLEWRARGQERCKDVAGQERVVELEEVDMGQLSASLLASGLPCACRVRPWPCIALPARLPPPHASPGHMSSCPCSPALW